MSMNITLTLIAQSIQFIKIIDRINQMNIPVRTILVFQVTAVVTTIPISDKDQILTTLGKGFAKDMAVVFRLNPADTDGISIRLDSIFV